MKSWVIGKDPDPGKDWGQEKGVVEDKMVVWHHQLNGHEFEQTVGYGEGQGSLVCCSPWGHRVGHNWVTEQQQQYQMHLTDICRVFHPKAAEYIFFSRVYVTFSRIDHMLGHKSRFSKFKKIDKPSAWPIKKKREIPHICKVRNEKREVTMDTTEIQRIAGDYYNHLYANKTDNLEEIYQFLERCNLQRLNQEQIEYMKRPIISTENLKLWFKNSQ